MIVPTVIVYRDELLGASETFIRAQGEALSRFTPIYIGVKAVHGVDLPSDRAFVLSDRSVVGRAKEIAYKGLGWAPDVRRLIERLNPQVVLAHFGIDGAHIMPTARRLGIPLVVTYHGFDATVNAAHLAQTHSGRRYLRRQARLKEVCRRFIAVSGFIRNRLLEQNFPKDKVLVHYIGIDTELFSPQPDVNREPIVLFVGRLVEKKGCEFLLRAMQIVQKALPESELVVIGTGPLRAALEQQARDTLRRYTFLGVQPPESIRTWMNRASVFCTPSITAQSGDAEGFGMVFIEAQSMGLPVVSFSSGGISEAVADGETGILAPERDWRALADSIAILLTNKGMWRRMSSAGQERVRRDFNVRTQSAKLEQIYVDVSQ